MGFHSWTGPLRDAEDSNLWGSGSEVAPRHPRGPSRPRRQRSTDRVSSWQEPRAALQSHSLEHTPAPVASTEPKAPGEPCPYKENSSTFFVPWCPHPW